MVFTCVVSARRRIVTESFPPFATEIIPGLTDSNQDRTPSFFMTLSAPSIRVVWPPLTCEPCTCPFLLPSPIFSTLPARMNEGDGLRKRNMGSLYRSGSWPLPRLDFTGNHGEKWVGRDFSKFANF